MHRRIDLNNMVDAAKVDVLQYLSAPGINFREEVQRCRPCGVDYTDAWRAKLIRLLAGADTPEKRLALNLEMTHKEIAAENSDPQARQISIDLRTFWWRCAEASVQHEYENARQI